MQLYSRVFLQILDSSIAEDYQLRHVFEDILKLADGKTGVVDMTRESMSRRLNIPPELLNEKINLLESPDPKSRDNDNDGRRLERLDAHRDWGWQILNWDKYDAIRTRADVAIRVERHRAKKAGELPPKSPTETEGVTAEQIYAEYPFKVGKPAALRAIRKAMEKVAPEKLLQITKAFAARRAGDTAFMPHPSTWFNQERYNDDPSTWTKNETSTKPNTRNLGVVTATGQGNAIADKIARDNAKRSQ